MADRTNCGRGIIGSFPGLKIADPKAMMQYDSTIEHDFLYFLEYEPTVLQYASHPFTREVINHLGETHHYTPDFEVICKTKRLLVECKPEARLNDSHTLQQIELGQIIAEEEDYQFVLVTDTQLRTGPQLDNLQILWRYRLLAVPHPVVIKTIESVGQCPAITLRDLAVQLGAAAAPAKVFPIIYNLLFHHILDTNLKQRLGPQSPLWLP